MTHQPTGPPTVYVACRQEAGDASRQASPVSVIPISTATSRAGKPIRVGAGGDQIAITPDGKTAYVLTDAGTVIPISTAANTPGKPIRVGRSRDFGPTFIAITPNGKTVYVANTA